MKKVTKTKLHKKLKQYEMGIAIVVGAILIYGVGVYQIASSQVKPQGEKHLVTFYDQGAKRVVLTYADTVRQALKAADLQVDSHDTVDPSLDSKLSSSYVDVIIYRSRLIAIHDGTIRQNVLTVAQSPNAILKDAKLQSLGSEDKATFMRGSFTENGTANVLVIVRAEPEVKPEPQKVVFAPKPNALTVSKGAQVYVDAQGVAHRETYYDLPMNIVIGMCGAGNTYSIRSDGAKIDQDGFVLIAANFGAYPRCSVVDTSLGPGKVYDTGGFAVRYPYGFDLATDWTNYDGR